MKLSHTLALVGILAVAGANAAMAGMSSGYIDTREHAAEMKTQTIGEQLASGEMTMAQVTHLIPFTGLTVAEAENYTVPEVVAMRWTNN